LQLELLFGATNRLRPIRTITALARPLVVFRELTSNGMRREKRRNGGKKEENGKKGSKEREGDGVKHATCRMLLSL